MPWKLRFVDLGVSIKITMTSIPTSLKDKFELGS